MKSALALVLALGCFALVGCADAPESSGGVSHAVVIQRIRFARQVESGVVEGVNIDGRVSDASDEGTCNKKDAVSPEGEPGIDNGLASLLPFIDMAAGGDPDGLIQGAINDGSLLLVLEMRGVDGFEDDRSVEVRMWSAAGEPLIGTDGWLVPGQSFVPDPARPPSEWAAGSIEDGVLRAGPIDAVIPIQVLNVSFELAIVGGAVRAELDLEGNAVGYLGGGVALETFHEVVTAAVNGDTAMAAPLIGIVNGMADLARSEAGVCEQMSTGLVIEAVPAFIVTPDGGV